LQLALRTAGSLAALLLFSTILTSTPYALAQAASSNSEWPHYAADLASSRYRPLDQINASNFNKLEIAWRFRTDNLGPRPEYKLEGTPLMVGGVVYATAGTRRAVVALDAATGELLWVHSEDEGERAKNAPRKLSGRGLAYWKEGSEERILYVTTGYRLISLDAKTGVPARGFGENGVIDLKKGVEFGTGQQIDLIKGEIGLHSTPMVVKDVVLVGSAFAEGAVPKTHMNSKGLVRAFNARTGKLLWTFRTIPKPGEFGSETWLDGSWAKTGNTGVWTQISVDEALGLAYLPVESPTGDYYGGHRPGSGLFGDTLVAVDLKTGRRKWYFQFVHHGLWDMDISSAPLLADITVNGKPIKAVAQPTKQGILYVFDRVTGEPVWPIEERPVAKGDVPGEWYSPTQPMPTKPPAYARNGVGPEDFLDFTPELHKEAMQIASQYRTGPIFTPPSVNAGAPPYGTLTLGTNAGGTNWPGGSYDPETHTVYVQACNSCMSVMGLVPPKPEVSDLKYVRGMPEQNAPKTVFSQPQEGVPGPAGRLAVRGLPMIKPPYGTITAINLDRGEIVWQVAHGETPDGVRNSPALKGINVPRTGQASIVGSVVTKTLVVSGDPLFTTIPSHGRGAILHAYDKTNGKEVGAVYMPAPQSGSPMTYMLNGRQYIVLAIGGIGYPSEYIAYRLPGE
jgi:quinoprotein glucose dehydrogenase